MKRNIFTHFARSLALAGCISLGGQAMAEIYPAGMVGSYEGQLLTFGSGLPYGKVTFTVPAKGKISGIVTAPDAKSYKFSHEVKVSGDTASATDLQAIVLAKTAGVARFSLNLTVKADGTFTAGGTANLPNIGGAYYLDEDTAFRAKTFTGKAGDVAEWAGSYTLAFSQSETVAGAPAGSGYASATIDAKGVMNYRGKLADGTTLTGKANPSEDATYLLFATPYKGGGYFKAVVDLDEIGETGKYRVANGDTAEVVWQKIQKTGDKAYPGGFGPLVLDLHAEPWTVPGKGETVAGVLGAVGKQFDFDIAGADLDFLEGYLGQIPAKLTFDTKKPTSIIPVFGDAYAPTAAAEWAKIWKMTINPKTGVYTGTLTIKELQQTAAVGEGKDAKYTPIKFISRKITIEGVLLRNVGDTEEPFVTEGFFTLPPLNPKTGTTLAGKVEGEGALESIGTGGPVLGAISPGTAGTYSFTFSKEVELDYSAFSGLGDYSIRVSGSLKGIPEHNASVSFTIAPDLSSIVFNGKKLPLVGDSRPVALVFSNASAKNYKNTLTVIVYLNTTTGQATGVAGQYVQFLSGKMTIPGGNFGGFNIPGRTVTFPIPGVAYYTGNSVTKTK